VSALVLSAAVIAAGCGSSSSAGSKSTSPTTVGSSASPTTMAAPTGAPNTITIKNFMFGTPITVKAGTTVTVMNTDPTTHTVAADDGSSFNTGDIPAGKSATFTAPKAGTYKFHCNIHNYMMGTLTVTA
jgi:plastocyanin